MKKPLAVMAMVLMAAVMAFPPAALAITTLSLWDGGSNYVQIADNGAGDTSPLLGVVTYNGAFGDWIVNVSTGITKPVLGSATTPSMDLSSVNVSFSGQAAGTLTIAFSDVGFVNNASLNQAKMHVGGTTQGIFTYKAFFDDSNSLSYANSTFPNTATLIDTVGPFSASGATIAFSGSSITNINPDPTFSLTEFVTIQHGVGIGSTSINASLEVIPVPASVLLLGSGILGLVGLGWRRRKAS